MNQPRPESTSSGTPRTRIRHERTNAENVEGSGRLCRYLSENRRWSVVPLLVGAMLIGCHEDYDSTSALNPDKNGNFSLECTGSESFTKALDLTLDPGTMPPRIVVWSHFNPAYRDYLELWSLEGQAAADWVFDEGISINDSGRALISCVQYEWTSVDGDMYTDFVFDRMKVIVG